MSVSANSNTQGKQKGSVQDLVQGVVGLISLPDVCIRVKEMVDNPECSAADIGKVVSKDAALTARLLRIVNSAFYQFPARIETVSRAITIVGNRELKDLVFAATVAGIFEKVSSDLIDIESFWRHAVYCGIVSRIIARKSRVLHSERLFVAGLMHDIGRMVIAFKLPDQCREVLRYRKEHDVELHVAEKSVLGFDHALVGAELMKAWSLPESHQLAALHHHSPEQASEFVLEASIVYLANIITELAEAGSDDVAILDKVPDAVWQMTKVSVEDIEEILVEARDQFIDALTLIRTRERKSSHHVA
jgi:HD-like signal output (HDOD) protein